MALREVGELLHRARVPARAAENRDGIAGLGQQLLQVGQLAGGGGGIDDLVARRVGHLGGFDQHVLGQRDHHRARTARGGDVESARDQFGNALDLVDFGDPLGLRAEDGAVVHFLEGFALAHAALDLADEQDHRGRVLLGDVHAGQRVGGARAAGHHADAGFAGQLAMGVRHHGGATFLTADGDLDVGVVQAVQHRQVALAGNAENVFDALGDELVDEDVAAEAGCLLGHGGCQDEPRLRHPSIMFLDRTTQLIKLHNLLSRRHDPAPGATRRAAVVPGFVASLTP